MELAVVGRILGMIFFLTCSLTFLRLGELWESSLMNGLGVFCLIILSLLSFTLAAGGASFPKDKE